MVLAGVVLKLATFGISVYLVDLLSWALTAVASAALGLATFTLLAASVSLLRQIDLKVFVALSSVAHMGNGTMGLLSSSEEGLGGAFVISLAHGLVSPGLFILTGGVLYGSFGSRLIYAYRGISNLLPSVSSFLFLFIFANMAVPVSPNWIAEFMVLLGLAQNYKTLCIAASFGVVASAAYSIWLYNRTTSGQ